MLSLSLLSSDDEDDDDEEDDDDDDASSRFLLGVELATNFCLLSNPLSGSASSSSNDDIMPYEYQKHNKMSDKSRGFKTQNQSKREYASFQHRNKRQKFF